MRPRRNVRWVLARRPANGIPAHDDFRREEVPIGRLGDRDVLVRTLYISIESIQRLLLDDAPTFGISQTYKATHLPAVAVGEPIRADGVGEVVESRDPRLATGDIVQGYLDWQTHAIVRLAEGSTRPGRPVSTAQQVKQGANVVRLVDRARAPLSTALHVLGEYGLTAYVGLLDVGRPRPGETVFVSSAAGLVGGLAGEIAKIKGCRAVGSTGSDTKVDYCTQVLGFDQAVNYRAEDVEDRLDTACPEGVDVYFDNVGGDISDLVLARMNRHGRVVMCGAISSYTHSAGERGARLYRLICSKLLRIEGFTLWDFEHRYDPGYEELCSWYEAGLLPLHEHVVDGIDGAPTALIELLEGRHFGKVLVRAGCAEEWSPPTNGSPQPPTG